MPAGSRLPAFCRPGASANQATNCALALALFGGCGFGRPVPRVGAKAASAALVAAGLVLAAVEQ